MSGDIESLLRDGLAEVADAAPAYDDPGLADAAIAGAGRIRRRRRVSAAASGASLLVLGAAAFVWQPWTSGEVHDGGPVAGSTSTSEAQTELDLEFVVEGASGQYEIYTEDDEFLPIGEEEPLEVLGMAEGYLVHNAVSATVVAADGAIGESYEVGADAYTTVNRGGSQFAIVTPNSDFTAEDYQLTSIVDESGGAPRTFTTSYELTLEDWSATTAVFTAELWSVTAGETRDFWFNDDHDLGLETVAEAGFEAVVLTDQTEPDYVCVADLDPDAGTSSVQESCGRADDESLRADLVAAASEDGATDLMDGSVARADTAVTLAAESGMDLGLDMDPTDQGDALYWTDPQDRWEIVGVPGADTWQLVDYTGKEPVLTELSPPRGAILPIRDFS